MLAKYFKNGGKYPNWWDKKTAAHPHIFKFISPLCWVIKIGSKDINPQMPVYCLCSHIDIWDTHTHKDTTLNLFGFRRWLKLSSLFIAWLEWQKKYFNRTTKTTQKIGGKNCKVEKYISTTELKKHKSEHESHLMKSHSEIFSWWKPREKFIHDTQSWMAWRKWIEWWI